MKSALLALMLCFNSTVTLDFSSEYIFADCNLFNQPPNRLRVVFTDGGGLFVQKMRSYLFGAHEKRLRAGSVCRLFYRGRLPNLRTLRPSVFPRNRPSSTTTTPFLMT